jgi:hypothetical protein
VSHNSGETIACPETVNNVTCVFQNSWQQNSRTPEQRAIEEFIPNRVQHNGMSHNSMLTRADIALLFSHNSNAPHNGRKHYSVRRERRRQKLTHNKAAKLCQITFEIFGQCRSSAVALVCVVTTATSIDLQCNKYPKMVKFY